MNKNFIFGLGLGYLFARGGARRNYGGADSTEGDPPPEEGLTPEESIAPDEEEPPEEGLTPDKEEVVDELIEQVSEDPQAEQEDRRLVEMYRIIRNSATVKWIKELYDNTCQVCRTKICGKGSYSEVAHIRPLYTREENGPLTASVLNKTDNLLCLCANCHASFDRCGWYLEKRGKKWTAVKGQRGEWCNWDVDGFPLTMKHKINSAYADYHRGDFCK